MKHEDSEFDDIDNSADDENIDDVVSEEDGGGDAALARLRKRLRECEKLKQEYLEGWQRARADFINAKKQEEERRGEFVRFVKTDVLGTLLPVLDSFEAAWSDSTAWNNLDETWRRGMENVYSQLTSALKEQGITEIAPLGELFDPKLHHSIESVKTEEKEKDQTIVEVLQKGYLLDGRVIRPATVKVAHVTNSS